MAIRSHECFLVLLFFISFPSFAVGELLCHPLLTAVVKGTENGGVLTTNNFVFEQNYYENFNGTHFRVCICTKVPCLRKCCPLGEVFINNTCSTFDLDINPSVFTSDLKPIPNYGISNFHRVYGDTCKHKSFQLEPEIYKTDEYFLISNGKLLLPYDNTIYETSQFCFENNVKLAKDGSEERRTLRAFVCFPDDPVEPENIIVYPVSESPSAFFLQVASRQLKIGMIISMPFLLVTFIVYSLPELRNLHGKNLMSHVASLLTAYIVLVVTQLGGHLISDTVCVVCGFLTPYAFLATFFWLNVMCFDIWSAFSGFGKLKGHLKENENKRFLLYSLYAWGCPTIILIVTVIIDYAPNVPDFIIKPNIGTTRCYFETKLATLVYFYAPMAAIVICDITLFALTAIKICKVRRETKVLTGNESRRNDEASKQRYNLYLKLFMVMGINWVMELISWIFEGPKEFWYVTDVMNSLQGLFIFWIFVCSRKIKKILVSKFCPRYAAREPETNTSSMKMSTSANSSAPTTDIILMNSVGGRRSGRAI